MTDRLRIQALAEQSESRMIACTAEARGLRDHNRAACLLREAAECAAIAGRMREMLGRNG